MKDGYVLKDLAYGKPSKDELELINLQTRREFKEDEVYVFSVILCDNDIDREFEKFTTDALYKLSELFVGKTGILDHEMKSDNQTARIFSCEVEKVDQKFTATGEDYYRLKARAYMPICEKNNNFILEIDSGIKKEVSVGCAVGKVLCSVCGQNVKQAECDHVKGKEYDGKLCHFILDEPIDAYEWSFVAVPAQKEAKVIKALDLKQKGGGNSLEEIIKKLELEESISLSKDQSKKLVKFINDLKEKAKDGQCYKDEMRNEVLRLCSLAEPNIDMGVMDSVTQKMSLDELKSFKSAFQNKASQVLPMRPQLSPIRKDKKKIRNTEFKI